MNSHTQVLYEVSCVNQQLACALTFMRMQFRRCGKDPSGKHPVSPLALEEAGCMTVCRSGAWGAKMVTSAWWVYADQVSHFRDE